MILYKLCDLPLSFEEGEKLHHFKAGVKIISMKGKSFLTY